MNKTFFISLLFGSFLSVNAQKTFNLFTNTIENGIINTIPTRDIEETSDGVFVTYTFNNVALFEDNLFRTSSFARIDGFQLIQEESKPSLITRWDPFVVLGEDATVSLVDSSYIDIPLELSPARPPLINSSSERYSLENVRPISPYLGFYPNSVIRSTNLTKYRNHLLLGIEICPLQYNYENKTVRLFKALKYKVSYGTSGVKRKTITFTDLGTLNPIVSNIITNSSILYKCNKTEPIKSSASQISNSHYLIITVPKYASSANRLAEWKRTLGFNVDVEIRSSWVPDSVRSVVLNSYNTNNTEYLLIIGSNDDVPGVYYHSNDIYTDVYYGCTNDSLSPYLSPAIFSYIIPELFRGRLLVHTPEESEIVVNKIINYEKAPPSDTYFYKTGLNSSFFEDDLHTGVEEYGYAYTSEIIRNRLIELGKTVHRI